METKARHFVVGLFVIALFAGGMGFLIWLARIDISREFAFYRIFFTDSVAGLGIGGDVRFNGIKIGSVTDIDIDRDEPSRVMVTVQVSRDVPVRADSYATLQLQGITGISFVQISGGSNKAAMLDYRPGREPPSIPSRPSQITQLFQQAPELLARGIVLLERVTDLFNQENQQLVGKLLNDTSRVTSSLANSAPQIEHLLSEVGTTATALKNFAVRLEQTAGQVEKIMGSAHSTLANIDRLVASDAKSLIADTRTTARTIERAAEELRGMLSETRPAVRDFSGDGLLELTRFLREARQLVISLTRLSERIENDPARLLFGEKVPERRAQ
jgi:phospholipid/cholesterol/gamma-HCH transport system substrate-binding protein